MSRKMDNKDLAYAIFGDIESIEVLEEKYPPRLNSKMVTRFAPSPTGFIHTGSLFAALIDYHMAYQNDGVFYIRLEDTDTKREIENSKYLLIDELKNFGISPNEGFLGDKEIGEYGPYVQSKRKRIYDIVINELIKKGRAYPCFCSSEELSLLREIQTKEKKRTGYYGEYAKCRNLPISEAIRRINNNEPFIIRFKSMGDFSQKISVFDEVRGNLLLSQNDLDIVIRKADGLPTYHFAHMVDDHFMRSTCIIRGEEWLPSLPIHLELFESLGYTPPSYAHLPVIMKVDNGKRRKLSKRYDKEASVSYFLESGYPVEAILEYLYTLSNSNYEQWRMSNSSYRDFIMSFDKMSLDGALFDIEKINSISKEFLISLSKEEMASRAYEWAIKYDERLKNFIELDYDYFVQIMSLEREKENPRKDYVKYSDIYEAVNYFNDDVYFALIKDFDIELKREIFNDYLESLNMNDEETWVSFMRECALKQGYALNNKEYKENMDKYKGTFGNYMSEVRIYITAKKVSQNLFYVGKIIGKEKLEKRFTKAIEIMSEK